jgi:hypothetical protein
MSADKWYYHRLLEGNDMPIAFFITDTGDFYADMEATSLDEKTYHWLSSKGIELGRKTSFTASEESPLFGTVAEAEKWLKKHWFSNSPFNGDEGATLIGSGVDLTEEHYADYARLAWISTEHEWLTRYN